MNRKLLKKIYLVLGLFVGATSFYIYSKALSSNTLSHKQVVLRLIAHTVVLFCLFFFFNYQKTEYLFYYFCVIVIYNLFLTSDIIWIYQFNNLTGEDLDIISTKFFLGKSIEFFMYISAVILLIEFSLIAYFSLLFLYLMMAFISYFDYLKIRQESPN